MADIESEIREMVHRETRAWDARDAEELVSIFHPDMVWPWPPDDESHDPIQWVFPQGRFDRGRWTAGWQTLFDTHELVHNNRSIIRVAVSDEQDGAFAVVDVDTLWRNTASGAQFHWVGRACKGYTRVGGEWKLIFHTGLLHYEEMQTRVANGMIMRSLERVPIRTREIGATTSAWRMTIDTPEGRGTITLLDGGSYRGDGAFLGRSPEELAGAYGALAVSETPPTPDLQQWG
ncbi:MAG: YybH family protein [Thermoanaerobaculia bacterium]